MIEKISGRAQLFFPEEEICAVRVRIEALFRAYGAQYPFFEIWRHAGGLIARLDGSFYLSAGPARGGSSGADYEEMAAFLRSFPDFFTILGRADVIRRLAFKMGSCVECAAWNVMAYAGFSPGGREGKARAERSPSLRGVYEILSRCGMGGPPGPEGNRFESWYADMNHRIRHGCGRAYRMSTPAGEAAACLLVSMESESCGLIGGVATLPEHRGRGYASALVLTACRDLLGGGKRPVLECEDGLLPFYRRLGFEKTGETAALVLRRS